MPRDDEATTWGEMVEALLITDLPPIIFGDGMKKQEVISIPDLKCRHVNRQIFFQSQRELWHYYRHVYRDSSQSQFSTCHSLA